ncbi:MAG: SPOR domain-containing protein [Erythrobacter sp.]
MMSADEFTADADELDLSDHESLPWLESDEDDDGAGAVDSARIIGFAVLLLVILAGIIGAIWFFSNRGGDEALVADGSTIEAPDGPFKERPDDPGGREFAGTGNVAPAVGEGETREGVVSDGNAEGADGASGPSIATRTTTERPVSEDGVGVQVGAYGTRAQAEAGWVTLTRQTSVLSGVRHRVLKGEADIGTVYRLQAIASDGATADRLCRDLKADGLACQVKR